MKHLPSPLRIRSGGRFTPRFLRLSLLLWCASLLPAQAQFQLASLGTNHQGVLAPAGPGAFNVTGGGNDAWDNFDECSFAYAPVSGDFSVQVRVASVGDNSQWSKAGLMIRETLSESSRMAFNRVTPPPVLCADGLKV